MNPNKERATEPEWWGVAEAASHCGVLPGTWRDYVARGFAPPPDDPDEGRPKNRRSPRWRPDTVKTWHASRPGHGGRPRKDPSGEVAGMAIPDENRR